MSKEELKFYRSEVWELLDKRLSNIEESQKTMAVDIINIKLRVNWMYAIAATIGVGANMLWQYIVRHLPK